MNYGTPQEMLDEEKEYYESIGEKPPESGCLPILILMVIGFIMLIISCI
jgi:membrane protein insertase Oxa1/YidC/SpoIIIJ